jgi:hypothetical protein
MRQRQDATLPKRPETNVPNPYFVFNSRSAKCRIFRHLQKLLYLKVTSVGILVHYQEIFGITYLKVLRKVLCTNIQNVAAGEVNILGGHSIGHSKQKVVCVHVAYSERFPR